MKIETSQLPTLLTLQTQLVSLKKLESQARELMAGAKAEAIREQLLDLSAKASQMLTDHEELQRDLKRAESDLDLVVKRIDQDQQRLTQATDVKVIAGVQHELETLGKRRSELEDAQLELMERVELSTDSQQQIQAQKQQLQSDLETELEIAKQDLAVVKQEHSAIAAEVNAAKAQIANDLLELFERLATRATAVGVLRGSTCGACNMNLTSTALGQIRAVAEDELARCPECSAILVRE
jgi:predicted  nucleic acid-binding Zn-ribbon protein